METRVKERLTGALILVAAMVIVVPEIFSDRRADAPRADVPDAAPATEGPPLRTYTADLSPADGGAPGTGEADAPARAPEPSVTAAPQPLATRATPEAQSPPPPSTPAARTPPEVPPVQGARDAAGAWFVQVGSFSQSANAERVAATLRSAGHDVVVLPPAGSKRLVRVRVGPVRDRAAAVDLQRRLAAAGHEGAVVSP